MLASPADLMVALMNCNDSADVTLVCNDKTKFKAHKFVLSAFFFLTNKSTLFNYSYEQITCKIDPFPKILAIYHT